MNTYLRVAAHLKCILMRWYHINKIIQRCFRSCEFISTSVHPMFVLSIVVWYCSSHTFNFTVVPCNKAVAHYTYIPYNYSEIHCAWLCGPDCLVFCSYIQRKYNVMHKTWSGSHSFLPRVAIYLKEMLYFIMGINAYPICSYS